MKKLFLIPLAVLAFTVSAFAQPQPQQTLPSYQYLGTVGTSGSICTASIQGKPFNDHTFIVTYPSGAPSAVTLTFKGSKDGTDPPTTTVTTSTSTTGATVHFTGEYTNLCVQGTSFTGTGQRAAVVYVGAFAQSLGSVTTDNSDILIALTAGTAKNQICDAGADCATVTGSKLDVNATVDTTGLATSTKQSDGTQKSQICDLGGDCTTVTGSKLDVNAAIDTTGLATSTKQSDGTQKSQIVDGSGNVIGATSNALDVNIKSGAATGYTQDAALTVATTVGTMAMGRASAAAPSDVSADNDAVIPWYVRSGAQAVQLVNAGVLTLSGSGTATGALRVELPTNGTGVIAGVTTVATVTNLAQMNGAAITMGNGASGTGVQRVTMADNSTGILAGVTTVGTVTNLAQMNGVAITMGNGASGTGVQRVTIADNSTGTVAIATPSTLGIYVEDAAETAGMNLNMMGAVRRDAAASSSTTDGDNSTLNTDALGRLWVNCGTGCSGGTQYTQDAALTVGSTVGTIAMGRASAAVPTDVSADNDAVMPWYLRSGAVAVQLTNAGVLTLSGSGTATGALRVELPTNGTGVIAGVTTVGTVTTVSTVTAVTSVNALIPGTGATNLGKAVDGAAGGTDTGVMALAVRDDVLATLTPVDGDYTQLRTNSTGALWVQSAIVDVIEGAAVGTNPVPTGCVYRTSFTTGDPGDVMYNLCDVNGRLIIAGTVTEDLGETAGNPLVGIGSVRRDTPTSSAGSTGDNATFNTSADGALWVTNTPNTTGGWTAFNATAADGATACTNTAQAVKASQGTFGGYFINNPNTADEWVHIYNTASGSVTVGTTNPLLTFRIPGAAANSVGANMSITNGVQFSTAIAIACTSTAAGNGAPANALEVDVFYK